MTGTLTPLLSLSSAAFLNAMGWLPGWSGLPVLSPSAHPKLTGVQHGLDAAPIWGGEWKGKVRQEGDRLPVFRGQPLWALSGGTQHF